MDMEPVTGISRAIFEKTLCGTPFRKIYPRTTTVSADFTVIRDDNHTFHVLDQRTDSKMFHCWPTNTLVGHTDGVNVVCVSDDGRFVVSGGRDMTVKVWEIPTGELLHTLTGHTGAVFCACFSGDGRYVVSGSLDKSIKVWNMLTGRLVYTFTGHRGAVSSVCMSGDGRYVVSGSFDKSIRVWEVATGHLLHTLTSHTAIVSSVCLSDDGRFAVSGSLDKSINLWEVSTCRLVHTFTGHTGAVSSIGMSGDGRYVVSGSWDKSIKVWETATGQLLHTLRGHTAIVSSVCLSGDGRFVVSGSHDKSIKVWNVSSLGCHDQWLHTMEDDTAGVFSVRFSRDGRYMVSGGADMTVKVWGISTGRLVQSIHTSLDEPKEIWLGPEDTTVLVLGDRREVWRLSVLKSIYTIPFDSYCLGRDGNVYGYVEATKHAVLVHSDTLNEHSVELALSKGHSSIGAFSIVVAATLLDLPKVLDAYFSEWGNSDIDIPQQDTGMSALAYALVLGHAEVVRVLLLHGANPSQTLQLPDGSVLDAMALGYCAEAARKTRWLPSTSLCDYETALTHNEPSKLFSVLMNNPSFVDTLIRSTLRGMDQDGVHLDVPTMAKKLNETRRLRSSQEVVQMVELVPVGVDLPQIDSILARHDERVVEQEHHLIYKDVYIGTDKDIIDACIGIMAHTSEHQSSGAWTLDNVTLLQDDLSSVESLLVRLDSTRVAARLQQAAEQIDHLELLLCGLGTSSTGMDESTNQAKLGDASGQPEGLMEMSKSVSLHVAEAREAMSIWEAQVQRPDNSAVEHTEYVATVVQSRLQAVTNCFGKHATVVDDSTIDIQSALEGLHNAMTKEKEHHANHQNVLKDAFPASRLRIALQSVRDFTRANAKQLQELLGWNDRIIELKEKLESVIRLYSQVDYQHLFEVQQEIEDLRLDIEELRVSQRRRQRTPMTPEELQEQQQAIADKKLKVKRLARESDVQKSLLVSLAEVGVADAMAVVRKLGGIEWSALKLEDFEDLERLVTPGQPLRRLLFKATLDGATVILKEYGLHSPESWHQLQSELKLLGRVDNPHVMPLRAAFVSEDKFKAYAVFPFFANGSLDVWIDGVRRANPSGRVSITQWESVWRQVLSGLQALHDRRIVHCDIKPSNIFVDSNHRVVVGDFDISQDLSQRTQTMATLCKVAGTLGYLAPELLATPPQPATPMVDMFAFGVTVASVMTASELESAESLAVLVTQCQDVDPQNRPTAAEALACPFFTQQVVKEKEELEREAKRIAALQAEIYVTTASVEEKNNKLLKDQQELQALIAQLQHDRRQAKKTTDELREEQRRVESLQRQVHLEKEHVQKETRKVTQLQRDLDQERIQLQKLGRIPRIPPYWSTSKYDMSMFQRVNVTADLKQEIQSLFNDCCKPSTLGRGRDQQHAGTYSRLDVQTVWRVENFKLWNKYVARKMELKVLAKAGKRTSLSSQAVATDRHAWVRSTQLNGRLNEKLLFHGTDSVLANIICEHGFDERVATLGGMFGAGIYFAEYSSKSDQYVRCDSQGLFYMFVSRVMLGTQVHITQEKLSQIRRPPDLPGQRGRCFDSVVFDTTGPHYREFIVYDRTQAYPEFLVAYRRK